MKHEKLFSFLWSCLLAFCISFGSTACMVTAFHMEVSLWTLAAWCAGGAIVCSLCFSLPLGPIPLGLSALALGYLWQSGELIPATEAILNRLSRQYHNAYGWEIIRWSTRVADEMEPSLILWLCILGCFIAMGVAWAVCRKRTLLQAVWLSILCLGSCLVVTDTVPDTPFLFLLLAGLSVLMLTHLVRKRNPSEGNRLTALLIVPVMLVFAVLFVAIPRESYSGQQVARKISNVIMELPMFSNLAPTQTVQAGPTKDQVDLTAVGYRMSSKTVVMEVTADYDGVIYLRSRALDAYDGESWTAGEGYGETCYWPEGLQDQGQVSITTRYAHAMQYVPYYALHTDPEGSGVGVPNDQQLTQYIYSCSEMPSEAWLSKIDTQENQTEETHLDDRVMEWAQPLAQLLTESSNTTHEKARAIGNYVRRSATYSTAVTRMPAQEKDFVKWFLEDSDKGYCVHFASAATVLLQASGIPARYVTGYIVQTRAGETVTVEADQAHAWAEYYLPGFGWTVLEATPPDGILQQEATQTQATTQPEEEGEALQTQPIQTQQQTEEQTDSTETGSGILQVLLVAVGVVLVLGGVLEGQYRLRRMAYNKRLRACTVNQKAIMYWQTLAYMSRLLGKKPEQELFRLAERAKFGREDLSQGDLQPLETALHRAEARLKHRGIYRLVYRYILAIY